MEKLPLYEITIDEQEDSFVSAIALVDRPAIEKNFLFFSEISKLSFAYDDERMELIGPAMIPNQEIPRKDSAGNFYNVFFSKETIRSIAQVFFKKQLTNSVNLSHTDVSANSFVFQSYITDKAKGISAPKGINAPDGSWIVGMKITDPDVWEQVKSKELKGFSVEGLFQLSESKIQQNHQSEEEEVLELLKQFNALLFKN